MTWHQWHQMASRSSRMNLFSRRACSKIPSDQGCHAMDLRGASAAPRGITDSVRNKIAASFFIQSEYAKWRCFGCEPSRAATITAPAWGADCQSAPYGFPRNLSLWLQLRCVVGQVSNCSQPAPLGPISCPPVHAQTQRLLRVIQTAFQIEALLCAQGGGEFRRTILDTVLDHHESTEGVAMPRQGGEAGEFGSRRLGVDLPKIRLQVRQDARRPAGDDFELHGG